MAHNRVNIHKKAGEQRTITQERRQQQQHQKQQGKEIWIHAMRSQIPREPGNDRCTSSHSRFCLETGGELEVPQVVPAEDGQPQLVLLDRLHPDHLEVVRVPAFVHVRVRHAPDSLSHDAAERSTTKLIKLTLQYCFGFVTRHARCHDTTKLTSRQANCYV